MGELVVGRGSVPGGGHAAASWANGGARTVHPSVLRRSSRVRAARRVFPGDRVADLSCGGVVVSRRWLVGMSLVLPLYLPHSFIHSPLYSLCRAVVHGLPLSLHVLFLVGLQALPDCLALHLARAEQSELTGDMDGARAAFENLVTTAPSALAYVHFMRFVRRVDGAPAARKAFARCRKDPAVTADTAHITYIAAAHIEYFLNKEGRIARNVFELGAFLCLGIPLPHLLGCRVAVWRVGCGSVLGVGVVQFLSHPTLFRSSSTFAEWCPRTSRSCHLCVGWRGVFVSAFSLQWITVTSCCVLLPLDHCPGSAPSLWRSSCAV